MDEFKKQANWRLKLDENEIAYGCSDAVLNFAKRLVIERATPIYIFFMMRIGVFLI